MPYNPVFAFRTEPRRKSAMPRRYISELNHQEPIDAVFVAGEKQLRPNRSGNLYLQVDLSDRSGSIAARIWNANETLYKSFDNGDYVRVVGTAQLYQGAMQIIASKLHRVDPAEVDPADFTPVPAVAVDKLVLRLAEILRGLGDPALQNLAECFLIDERLMANLTHGAGRHQEPSRLSRRTAGAHRRSDGIGPPRQPLLSRDQPRLAPDGRIPPRPGQDGRTGLRARPELHATKAN